VRNKLQGLKRFAEDAANSAFKQKWHVIGGDKDGNNHIAIDWGASRAGKVRPGMEDLLVKVKIVKASTGQGEKYSGEYGWLLKRMDESKDKPRKDTWELLTIVSKTHSENSRIGVAVRCLEHADPDMKGKGFTAADVNKAVWTRVMTECKQCSTDVEALLSDALYALTEKKAAPLRDCLIQALFETTTLYMKWSAMDNSKLTAFAKACGATIDKLDALAKEVVCDWPTGACPSSISWSGTAVIRPGLAVGCQRAAVPH